MKFVCYWKIHIVTGKKNKKEKKKKKWEKKKKYQQSEIQIYICFGGINIYTCML